MSETTFPQNNESTDLNFPSENVPASNKLKGKLTPIAKNGDTSLEASSFNFPLIVFVAVSDGTKNLDSRNKPMEDSLLECSE